MSLPAQAHTDCCYNVSSAYRNNSRFAQQRSCRFAPQDRILCPYSHSPSYDDSAAGGSHPCLTALMALTRLDTHALLVFGRSSDTTSTLGLTNVSNGSQTRVSSLATSPTNNIGTPCIRCGNRTQKEKDTEDPVTP